MSFTYSGFVKDTIDDIISRISTQFMDAMPTVSLDPSNPLYQWMKVVAEEELYMQNLIEQAISNMTVMGASGIFLDYHAIEAGLFRKDAIASNGYVQCTNTVNDYTVPLNSVFSTSNGFDYNTYSEKTFKSSVEVTRGEGAIDAIPSTYTGLSISGVWQDSSLTIPFDGADYTYAADYVTWVDTGAIPFGHSYYLASTGLMTINIPITAQTNGIAGNTAANTISINTNLLPIVSMNNVSALDNGIDQETDESLRFRILESHRKTFTLDRINDIILQIDGVKESRTYQNVGVDRFVLDDWNNVTGTESMIVAGTGTYGFSFYPSGQVGTLQGITLYGRTTGHATELEVYLTNHSSGAYTEDDEYFIAKSTVDRGVLSTAGEDTFQDVYIPLKYNGMDRTKTYRVYMHTNTESDANNYWEFALTGQIAAGNYRLDNFDGNDTMNTTGYAFKTHYGLPGYTVSVVPEDGTLFTQIEGTITGTLDYIDGGGNSPICIQSIVQEATKIYLGLSITVFMLPGYTLAEVSTLLKTNISKYLAELHPGDDIIYSQVEKAVLNTVGLKKERSLQINIDGGSWVTRILETDLLVDDNEYVALDTDSLYSGITILQG